MGPIIASRNDLSFSANCSVHNQTARNFTASGNADVVGLECENLFQSSGSTNVQSSKLNKMNASGATKIFQSTVNELYSAGALQASDCPRLGKVTADGCAAMTHCKEVEEIIASGAFTLDASKVTGNVFLFGNDQKKISDSTIAGKMECLAKIVKISNSTIGRIIVKPIKSTSSFSYFSWRTSHTSDTSQPIEQIVELSGKNCRIGSISFEDGAFGKVRLMNGAKAPTVSGAEVTT